MEKSDEKVEGKLTTAGPPVDPVVPHLHVIVGSHTLLINGSDSRTPDSSVDLCSLYVAHELVQLVSRRLSLEVGESKRDVLIWENEQGQHHLDDLVHVSIFTVGRLQTDVLNFPPVPNRMDIHNDDPHSWICGRIPWAASHTSCSSLEIKHMLSTAECSTALGRQL